jgi:dUTPase
MRRFSEKKNKFISNISRIGEIPELEPGQILIAVDENKILDTDIMPYANRGVKIPWVNNHEAAQGPIKTCPGTTDLIALGVTVPLWADLRCRMSPDGGIEAEFNIVRENQFAAAGMIQPFDFNQTGTCPWTDLREKPIEKSNYLKLVSPFYVKTPKGYSSLIIGNPMYPRKEFDVIPGIVNTDQYHTMNVVLNVRTASEFYVAQGTPIAQVIVYKRSDNIKEIIEGDETVHRALYGRGFGGPWAPVWRKGKYKREQRRWDR